MSSRSTDIIVLLGAGASVEADIPASTTMIGKIESLLRTHEDWKSYLPLYHHVKSAILYAAGLRGQFGDEVLFNIEVLVNTLYELERNEDHPLYPFIASWNLRFVDLAQQGFSNVQGFRRNILQELKRWMCPEDQAQGDYYSGLRRLQEHLNYPLHVFSLNYDMCVERVGVSDFVIESGFDGFGPRHLWDWERFEQSDSGPPSLPQMYLYKLHGSINWKRDAGRNLFRVEQIENVASDQMDIIFGRDFKLQAADPYLFYAYQFRRFTLDSQLILVIGYSFGDDHINRIIAQAFENDPDRKLLVVSRCLTQDECCKRQSEIAGLFKVDGGRVDVFQGSAKDFLKRDDIGVEIVSRLPSTDEAPF